MNSEPVIKSTMNKILIHDSDAQSERVICEKQTNGTLPLQIPLSDLEGHCCDNDLSNASSFVTDPSEYTQPLKKLKLPVVLDVVDKEATFTKPKSLVSMTFTSEASMCLGKFPSVHNAELSNSGLSRKERRRIQIAAVLEEASAVGLAVEEMERSANKVADQTTSTLTGLPVQPNESRRHRPQRRNSFVIHRDRVGFGFPFPMLPGALPELPEHAPEHVERVSSTGNVFPLLGTIIDSSESYQSEEVNASGSIRSSQMLPQVLSPSRRTIPSNDFSNTSSLNPKQFVQIDPLESSCDMQNSLVSLWSRGQVSTPVLTKETKEFYGYE